MPIISDHAVDAGEKIAKVLPIGIFTAFQYTAAQITVAFCDPIEVGCSTVRLPRSYSASEGIVLTSCTASVGQGVLENLINLCTRICAV